LLLSDGSLWQSIILKELKVPFISLPQRGTVSASALDLALALSNDKIFIAGMDLANRDIRSHARPYSFDRLIEERAGRMNPEYSQLYKRSTLLKEGGSYGIYASWFKKQLASYTNRLLSLGKNHAVFDALKTAPEYKIKKHYASCGKAKAGFKIFTVESEGCLSQKAFAVLKKALKESAYREALQKELTPLLFADRAPASPDELLEALRIAAGSRGTKKDG
jgi:hypothetical protein